VWENGHAHQSDITISGNTFTNDDPNRENTVAFRVTSHSGAGSTVEYSGNTIANVATGFEWLAVYFGNPQDYSGTSPVQLTNNVINGADIGFDIGGVNASATISGGSVTGASGIGVNIAADASAT